MIFIENCAYFKPKDIFECGQVFRFVCDKERYRIISLDKTAEVYPQNDGYVIESSDDDYFRNYFDLHTDYKNICNQLAANDLMCEAINFGSGIRILKQDKWETLISFIISSNNHIPRIKGIIERLCRQLGEKRYYKGFEYYTFPTIDSLASCGEDYFLSQGLGYRAKYICNTAKAINNGFSLEEINSLSTVDARKKLCELMGVGPKVADCILLFSYSRFDAFPVDTWMEKVYMDYFSDNNLNLKAKQISEYFVRLYGNLSGYAQQYLFYYKREL